MTSSKTAKHTLILAAVFGVLLAAPACAGDLPAGNIGIPGAPPATVSEGSAKYIQSIVNDALEALFYCHKERYDSDMRALRSALATANMKIQINNEDPLSHDEESGAIDPTTHAGKELLKGKADAAGLADIINRLQAMGDWDRRCHDKVFEPPPNPPPPNPLPPGPPPKPRPQPLTGKGTPTHRTTSCTACKGKAKALNDASDKWLADQAANAPPVQLMYDEADVRQKSDALDACERTCHEHSTAVHRGNAKAVSEDNPLYMQNYKAPAKQTTTHKKNSNEGQGPSQSDVDRQTDQPSNDNDHNPDIPVPH
jgi:hypothetical protein